VRGPRFTAIVQGETGRIGGAENAKSPEAAVRLARTAAQGMFFDGHIVVSALRLEAGIALTFACREKTEVAFPYPANMKDLTRADVKCPGCLIRARGVS